MIRPTVRAAGTLTGGSLLLLAGALLGYRELVAIGLAGIAAVAVCAAWAVSTPRLAVDRAVQPARVRRGEAAVSVVDVLVLSRTARTLQVVDVVGGPDGQPVEPVEPTLVTVRPGLPTRIRLGLPTARRGVFQVGPLRLGRADPLGMWTVLRPVGTADQLTVWPAWHALTRSAVGRTAQLGGARDLSNTDVLSFHTMREYVPGDDLRHVHWRTTARVGTMMVRTHEGATVARQVLLLDDRHRSYVDADDFETAIEVAASVVVSTASEGLRLVLAFATDPARARPVGSTVAALDLLASARLSAVRVDDEHVEAALRRYPGGDSLLVVTGARAEADFADRLSTVYRSTSTVVVDPEPRPDAPRVPGRVRAASAARLVALLQEQG